MSPDLYKAEEIQLSSFSLWPTADFQIESSPRFPSGFHIACIILLLLIFSDQILSLNGEVIMSIQPGRGSLALK